VFFSYFAGIEGRNYRQFSYPKYENSSQGQGESLMLPKPNYLVRHNAYTSYRVMSISDPKIFSIFFQFFCTDINTDARYI